MGQKIRISDNLKASYRRGIVKEMYSKKNDNGATVQGIAYEIATAGRCRRCLKWRAYARVSTDKEDQINSLTNQREYFESYIKVKGRLGVCRSIF